MQGTTLVVQKRHIRHCHLADPAYGEGVAKALGISISDVDMDNLYGARG
jgi:catalase